jgi:hypothetical protein
MEQAYAGAEPAAEARAAGARAQALRTRNTRWAWVALAGFLALAAALGLLTRRASRWAGAA